MINGFRNIHKKGGFTAPKSALGDGGHGYTVQPTSAADCMCGRGKDEDLALCKLFSKSYMGGSTCDAHNRFLFPAYIGETADFYC